LQNLVLSNQLLVSSHSSGSLWKSVCNVGAASLHLQVSADSGVSCGFGRPA
jgi:hypothetical protein